MRSRGSLTGLAVVIAGLLAFKGLTLHVFWDDEANTAIFARNFLRTETLQAWDGRNLIAYFGGGELNRDLVNTYMPPLQYWVAAGGMHLLGESTLGARVPFVLAGLACIACLALVSRHLFGEAFPWFLPPLILALTPAFLLYIRNARYYALSALFFVVVLAAWCALEGRRRAAPVIAGLALGMLGLWLSHYLSAAAAVAGFAALFCAPLFRGRRHAVALGIACAVSLGFCTWLLLASNPFLGHVGPVPVKPKLERIATLLVWHLKGLATFEFVPVALAPVLGLPFVWSRVAELRPLAWRGLAVVGLILVSCIVTAVLSPQLVSIPNPVADMRQQVPVIALGALMSAVALYVLWRASHLLALAVAVLLLFTNVLQLGFLSPPQPGFEARGVACTLCDYVRETFVDRQTGTELLLGYLDELPPDTLVFVKPVYMAYPAMFYLPRLRYAQGLPPRKRLSPGIRSRLPDYVFLGGSRIDVAVMARPPRKSPPRFRIEPGRSLPQGIYEKVAVLEGYPLDRSRPEIPWHTFDADALKGIRSPRFMVYRVTHPEATSRTDVAGGPPPD
jgi:uncharacterized membrane protein